MSLTSGPYEIRRPLGMGGMAETFVAVRHGPEGIDHTVCLKRVLPALAREPRFVSQFLDEARILSHLRHGNIVSMLDFGKDANGYYMALELVDGVDLAQLLRQRDQWAPPLCARVAAYVAASLFRALRYAHNLAIDGVPAQLVHRDISPSNVLLSRHGEVKLADFGIASAHGRKTRTNSGQTKGKLLYMSPEQVRAEPLDSRSDLFSLGVVLHEILTGYVPFRGRSELELMQRIASGAREEIPNELRVTNEGLWDLIDALLTTDRTLRVKSAESALERLRNADLSLDAQEAVAELVAAHRPSVPAATTVSGVGLSRWRAQDLGPVATPAKSGRYRRRHWLAVAAILAGMGWTLHDRTGAPLSDAAPPLAAAETATPSPRVAPRPHEALAIASPPSSLPTSPVLLPTGTPQAARVTAQAKVPSSARAVARAPHAHPAKAIQHDSSAASVPVRIAVIPFGNVWVDGRVVGPSPAQLDLAVGKHLVEVGRFDAPTKQREIQAVAGEQHVETFNLLESSEEPKR